MFSVSLWRGSRSESLQGTSWDQEKREPSMSVDVSMFCGSSSDTRQSVSFQKPSQLPGIKRQVVEAALKKTLDKDFLDICMIDKVIELVGSRQSGEAYRLLRALHCVHFSAMDDELRSRIPMLINEVLNQQSPTAEVVGQILDGVNFE